MHVFHNQDQLDDAAIMLVARFTFDIAVDVISQGNIADESELVLAYLLDIAQRKRLPKKSLDAITFYLSQVSDENCEMLKYR